MAGAWRRTDLDSFDPEDQEGLAWFFHLHDEVDLAIRLLRVVAREKAILSLRRLRQDVALKMESSDRRFKLLAKISGIDLGEEDTPRRDAGSEGYEGIYTEPATVRNEMRYQSDFVGQEIDRLDREQNEELDELAGAAKEMAWHASPNQWREDLARLLDQFRELRASSDANNGGSFIEGFLKAVQSAGAFKLRALKKREKATVALYRNVQTVLACQGKRWAFACSVSEGELIKRGVPVSNRLPPIFEDSGFYLLNKHSERSITAEEVEEAAAEVSDRLASARGARSASGGSSAREREAREAEAVAATMDEAKRRAKEAIARRGAQGVTTPPSAFLLEEGAQAEEPQHAACGTHAGGHGHAHAHALASYHLNGNGELRASPPPEPVAAANVVVASLLEAEEARERLGASRRELDERGRELDLAIRAKEAAEERAERLARERDHLRQELQMALNVKDDMQSRRDGLLAEAAQLSDALAAALRELEGERGQKAEWRAALERERAEMRALSREIVQVANEAEREVAKVRELQRENAALKARAAELERAVRAAPAGRLPPEQAPPLSRLSAQMAQGVSRLSGGASSLQAAPSPSPRRLSFSAAPSRADKELQTSPGRGEAPAPAPASASSSSSAAVAARLARRVEDLEEEVARARAAVEALQRERAEAAAELRSALTAEARAEARSREAVAAMTGDMRRLAKELNACLDEKDTLKRQLDRLLARSSPAALLPAGPVPPLPRSFPPPLSAPGSGAGAVPAPLPAGSNPHSSSSSSSSSSEPAPLPRAPASALHAQALGAAAAAAPAAGPALRWARWGPRRPCGSPDASPLRARPCASPGPGTPSRAARVAVFRVGQSPSKPPPALAAP
eukprot:tig00000989_g6123.t1